MDGTHCFQQSPSCSTLFFLFQLLRSELTFVPSLMFVPPLLLYNPILPTSALCCDLLYIVLLIFYLLAFTFCVCMKCNENVKQDLYQSLTNSFSSLSWLIMPFSGLSVASCSSVSLLSMVQCLHLCSPSC